ncbi:MAG: chemotaxis protein CheX [Candidatus Coatesbacteria bacterium]|nr:chemotaxis protein CheX [Candidatus Coatesbacteria bacterium]
MPRSLLVGFRPVLSRMATNVLKSAGYDVAISDKDEENVKEADIVLFEARQGTDVRSQIADLRQQAKFKDIPILVVGEHSAQEAMDAAIAAGGSECCYLPLDPQTLPLKLDQMLHPNGHNQKIDVNIINPFVAATLDVMKTMAGITATRKSVFLKRDQRMFGDLSGVIGLSGGAVGSAVISFPEALAKNFVAKMLSEDPNKIPMDDVRDGVGECVNMIAGAAKAALANSVYHFKISIPTVVEGHGHEISHRRSAPCIVIVFEAEHDEFALQISLAINSDTDSGGN